MFPPGEDAILCSARRGRHSDRPGCQPRPLERSASTDKTFKLYPGMWHGLTAGEPDENVELVFSDIVAWLDECSRHWKPQDQVRPPSEPEQLHQMAPTKITRVASSGGTESPVPAHNRPHRRGSFLCGLGGRPYQQQCRM